MAGNGEPSGLGSDSERKLNEGNDNNNGRTIMTMAPTLYFHGPQFDNAATLQRIMEQMRAVATNQAFVLGQIQDLRVQNRHYQTANAALVAMNANQVRLSQQIFAAYLPNLDAEMRRFHEAEAAAAPVPVNQQTMWQIFCGWSRLQQAIFVLIVVGITAVAGYFAWKLIAFLWPKIIAFIGHYGSIIVREVQDFAQIVCDSPIFVPLRQALQHGNPLEVLECCHQLVGWQALFTILALFLRQVTGAQQNPN